MAHFRQQFVHPKWVKYIVDITKGGVNLYLPSEYRGLINALTTPLDASNVLGDLSWEMLDRDHCFLSLALRKKLGMVPPRRNERLDRRFFQTRDMADVMRSNPAFSAIVKDEIIVTGYSTWNTPRPAPTAEILMDIAHQLSSTSNQTTKQWFVLICEYVDPFGKSEPFDNFLKDRDGKRVPTDVFRTLAPRLYGPNGERNNMPIESLPGESLKEITRAWREGQCIVELLTAQLLGDAAGDTLHN